MKLRALTILIFAPSLLSVNAKPLYELQGGWNDQAQWQMTELKVGLSGLRHKVRSLSYVEELDDKISLGFTLSMRDQGLEICPNGHRQRAYRFEIMPRYQVSPSLSWGLGFAQSQAGEIAFAAGDSLKLETGESWMFSSRFGDQKESGSLELRLAQTSYSAHQSLIAPQEKAFIDTSLHLSYQISF
ncbi:hypothetical protein [Bowmanella dokdonensis]|uniref:Outer membrane protein beta-barrel domain-containing protein n=1 Tax=Bowmanella dokdonensis TaxID=751969 RepID=A0A939DJP4_9ALTE|nr:hypothetical protein [Bowmanella dokdonensis]MBN7823984.1 hypothetical protein [Bowmanella dokdonensis]